MGDIKRILAKSKAIDIINSCENCYHYKTAENYIKQYNIVFGDLIGMKELLSKLQTNKIYNLTNENWSDW